MWSKSSSTSKSLTLPSDCWWAEARVHHGPVLKWCWWHWGAQAAIRSSLLPRSPPGPHWPASLPHSCFWCKTLPGRGGGTLYTGMKTRQLKNGEKMEGRKMRWARGQTPNPEKIAMMKLCWLRHHYYLIIPAWLTLWNHSILIVQTSRRWCICFTLLWLGLRRGPDGRWHHRTGRMMSR